MLDGALAAAYLERLGVDARPGEVDAAMLAALQRAHVAAVPYENIDIVRGSPPGIDPYDCVRRVLAGRGGYCYHLNGSFATVLEWLGVDLTRHLSGVQGRGADAPGPNGNHLGLTVRVNGSVWLVDAGLGDGPKEPLPLAPGTYERDGFVYRVEPSPFTADGWRLRHDPRGAFELVDFSAGPATTTDFLEMHTRLSTNPESGFVRVAAVLRHTPGGVDILRGCIFTERTQAGDTVREIDSADDWWSLVIDRFGLAYGDLTPAERNDLWRRVRAGHEDWQAETQSS